MTSYKAYWQTTTSVMPVAANSLVQHVQNPYFRVLDRSSDNSQGCRSSLFFCDEGKQNKQNKAEGLELWQQTWRT